MLIIIYDS
ncbi:hypothetical protein ZEAMMB73_Zm00001d024064 [Zea mays]|uniref:Uncharacterized protein n=1 Tax=Zea mays TaxID=4577 RepID=A0A1D6IXK4_MAIZE|nr:hypothetical protein ZEAMMB73_Zm00001d024064 [Zea mays]